MTSSTLRMGYWGTTRSPRPRRHDRILSTAWCATPQRSWPPPRTSSSLIGRAARSPETLARAGFTCSVKNGPGPDDYTAFELRDGTVATHKIDRPSRADLVYAFRPIGLRSAPQPQASTSITSAFTANLRVAGLTFSLCSSTLRARASPLGSTNQSQRRKRRRSRRFRAARLGSRCS